MKNSNILIETPIVLPGDPELPQLLAEGLEKHKANCLSEAEQIYNAFLQQHPEHSQVLAFLGALVARNGKFSMAVTLLRKAIQNNPNLADPRYCMSSVLLAQGMNSEAVTPCSYALAFGHPSAKQRLESLLNNLGAEEHSRSSNILARTSRSKGQFNAALKYSQEAIKHEPNDFFNWLLFSQCISRFHFDAALPPDLLTYVRQAFTINNLEHKKLTRPAICALYHNEKIAPLLSYDEKEPEKIKCLRESLHSGSLESLSQNELFNRLLRLTFVDDIRLEKFLTSLREAFLWNCLEDPSASKNPINYLSLIVSLSNQCFLNEYIWMMSAKETAAIDKLASMVEGKIGQKEKAAPHLIAIFSAYRPLYTLSCAEELLAENWPDEMSDIIKTQLFEPLKEIQYRESIPTLLPLSGSVSQMVRSQYEENPFPRWSTLPVWAQKSTMEEYIGRVFPNLRKEEQTQPGHPQILVAGCGTGWIPNDLANRIENSSITALDLSLASLGYAQRKSKELGFENIEYVHGDIQNLGELQMQFDHINCFGVLHHMEDPLKGWRALNDSLKPGGTMEIGLYSEMARRSNTQLRQYIEEQGFKASSEGMRDFRQHIIELDDASPFKTITNSHIFYCMSELRDTTFHAQELMLTIPKIENMLAELELQFIGFVPEDPSIQSRYRSRFPQDTEMRSLELWHQFEVSNPNTFSNCYTFWVRKPT
ncbi:MAG: methyltransferase domain-containing protein [Methylococcales bacterium]